MINPQIQSFIKKRKIRPIILLQSQNKINEAQEEEKPKCVLKINLTSQQSPTIFNVKDCLRSLKNYHSIKKKLFNPTEPYESRLSKYFDSISHDNISTYYIKSKQLQNTNSTNITPTTNKIEFSQDNSNNNLKQTKSNLLFTSIINSPKEDKDKQMYKSNSCNYIRKPNEITQRLRSYQPIIDFDWKFKCGLSIKATSLRSSIVNNIDFQNKSFQEQIGLLFDNINYFKCQIVRNEYLNEALKNMPYESKVNLNKDLEELCGILLLCPQALLMEFYSYVEQLDDIYLPNKQKFVEVYVSNESNCFYYNYDLLMEVSKFFTKCFDFYLILSKQVEGITFHKKYYDCIISILERARYDISLIIKRGENAIKTYKSDLALIKKIRREDKTKIILTRTNSGNIETKHLFGIDLNKRKLEMDKNVVDKIVYDRYFRRKEDSSRIKRINEVICSSKECFSDGECNNKPYISKKVKTIIVSQ